MKKTISIASVFLISLLTFSNIVFAQSPSPTPVIPGSPIIEKPSAPLYVESAYLFSFKASNNVVSTVSYQIDWDANGTVDQTLGPDNSNKKLSITHEWALSGTKTFKARTVGSTGGISSWVTDSVTILEPEPTNTPTPTSTTIASAGSTGATGGTLADAGIAFPTIIFTIGAGFLIFIAILLAL